MHGWDKRGEKGRGGEKRRRGERVVYVLGSIDQSINQSYVHIPGMY